MQATWRSESTIKHRQSFDDHRHACARESIGGGLGHSREVEWDSASAKGNGPERMGAQHVHDSWRRDGENVPFQSQGEEPVSCAASERESGDGASSFGAAAEGMDEDEDATCINCAQRIGMCRGNACAHIHSLLCEFVCVAVS